MPIKNKPGVDPRLFKNKYTVDPRTKCWNWRFKLFRFKTDGLNLNPRRFAIYMNGGAIPVGRHVIAGCGNEYCINPEHTRLRHNGAPIEKSTKLYLEFEDFNLGRGLLRHKYFRKFDDICRAWKDTLQLIVDIRHEPPRMTNKEIADKYNIGETYVATVRKLDPYDFDKMKVDKYSTDDTPVDELECSPDARYFTMEGVE